MIGRSPLMLEVFARIERIAPHYRTVLVTGPTGSGKELVARALHQASPVASGPFVVCNAAAIPENLIESELFGHVKGAFTGATQDKAGLFEAAHGGTILLDEIGDMPLGAQAKLLRAVQHQEVQRVGASGTRKVNVRIVAATHRDLRSMVAERTFREDLFFRLGMVEIRLPQLADRKEDLPLLLRHFVDKFAQAYNKPIQGFTRKAEIAMNSYSWPGNIRELEGVVGAAAMMAEPPLIDVGDLPPQVTSSTGMAAGNADGMNLNLSLEDIQVVHAHRVVDSMNGDKVRAAQVLGVSRATLYRLLAKTPPQSTH
jgi:DNA-binding NtrC family response regulator